MASKKQKTATPPATATTPARATAAKPTTKTRGRPSASGAATAAAGRAIRFTATLHRPAGEGGRVAWTFLRLPKEASHALPSRSQVSVEGSLNGATFAATLEPDGEGGHWLRVERALRTAAGVEPGDRVTVDMAPAAVEPEPTVPADLRAALQGSSERARSTWADITPIARRDWIQWIVSAKQLPTRERRIRTACDMLEKGKRRPCCFDRSGMYAKSLRCPVAEELPPRSA